MTAIKKMVSFNPLVLQALDATARALRMKRSALIERAILNDPDIDQVYEGIKEANKAVSNEEAKE